VKGEHSLADNAELGPHLADLGLMDSPAS